MKSIRPFVSISVLILSLVMLASCGTASFVSSESGSSDAVPLYTIKSDIVGQEMTIEGASFDKPLSVIFLLDVTGSMSAQIASVKNNINTFVSNLNALNYQVKVGLVAFRDKITNTVDLKADLTEFKSVVGSLSAAGGGDAQEFALGAIEEALNIFSKQETNPDALRVMMLVTDNPGHREPSDTASTGTRDCSIEATKGKFASISETMQKNVKFFYSVPSFSSTCSGYNATSQMRALIEGVLPKVGVAKRGASIAWPFDGTTFSTILPTMIKEVSPPSQAICLADEVIFDINGIAYEFKSNFKDEYARYKKGKALSISPDINDLNIPSSMLGADQSITVTKKCFSYAAAEKSDFSKPVKTITSKGTYKIVLYEVEE